MSLNEVAMRMPREHVQNVFGQFDAFVKEPIQLMPDEPNDKGQYLFGIVKIDESGSVPLPDKALSLMEILPGDRMLLLGDKAQGLAIVKCDGINDYLEMEEKS